MSRIDNSVAKQRLVQGMGVSSLHTNQINDVIKYFLSHFKSESYGIRGYLYIVEPQYNEGLSNWQTMFTMDKVLLCQCYS